MRYFAVILVVLAGIGFYLIFTLDLRSELPRNSPGKQDVKRGADELHKVIHSEEVQAEKTHFEKRELDEMRGSLIKEHLKLLSENLGVNESAIEPPVREEFMKWQREFFPPFAKRCLEKKLQGFDSEYTEAVKAAVNAANKKIAKAANKTPDEIEILRSDFVQKMYFAKEED